MSDYRAIGAVSETLRQILLHQMERSANVTIAPPDVEADDPPRVNLFLYRVEESGALKNQDLPGMASPGSLGRPPLSLELHYLLTAFGADSDDRNAQELLGDAMRALHENAIVPKSLLDPALSPIFEAIRISLEPTTLEDLTKIWSALNKPYRFSAGYKVTVVQIESREPRQFAQPVAEPPQGGPRITAVPFAPPVIRRLLVIRQGDPDKRERPFAYARIGDSLVLEGTSFTSGMRVILGAVDAVTSITSLTGSRIVVTVPDDAELQPGPVTVKVQSDVMLGDPLAPHRGFASNLAVFILTPHLAGAAFDAGPPRRVTLTGTRIFQEDRPCFTMLGETLIDASTYVSPASTHFSVSVPAAMAAGTYPIRVRVNGAETIDSVAVVIP